MRKLIGVPCVAFVDPAVCTLAAIDRSTGIVYTIDRYARRMHTHLPQSQSHARNKELYGRHFGVQ